MRIKISLLLLVAFQSLSFGGIIGSPHDLSNNGWGTTENCKFCHTPHKASVIPNAPLWNRQLSVSSYDLYQSPYFKGSRSQSQPSVSSKLCLGCHDGTVAVDSYAGEVGSHFISSTNVVGGNSKLTADHPISFSYDAVLVSEDRTLATPVSSKFVDNSHVIPLYDGRMECGSCHEPHDNVNLKFLRVKNNGSSLCFKCHLK